MRGQKWSTKWRVWTVMAAIVAVAGVLIARLGQLQILNHQEYAAEARLSHVSEDTLSGRRGALLDRNGYPLAGSQDSFDLMVETKAWSDSKNATESAAALSPIAGVPAEQMVASVAGNSTYELPVARGLNYDQAQADLTRGDFVGYAQEIKFVGDILKQLAALQPASPSTSASAKPSPTASP